MTAAKHPPALSHHQSLGTYDKSKAACLNLPDFQRDVALTSGSYVGTSRGSLTACRRVSVLAAA